MNELTSRRDFLQAVAVVGAAGELLALSRSKLNSSIHLRLGREQFWRKEWGAALVSLSKAIEVDPTDEEVLDLRSVVFDALGYIQNAIADRTEIIRLNPSAQNVLMRGVYALGHEPALAVADFSEVIRREPQHADAYFYRALAYEESGLYALALADYARNARLDPGNAEWLAEDIARIRRMLET